MLARSSETVAYIASLEWMNAIENPASYGSCVSDIDVDGIIIGC